MNARKLAFIYGLLVALLITGLGYPRPVHAEGNISVTGATFGCSAASITYSVAIDAAGPIAVKIYRADDTFLGEGSGPGTPGSYTVNVTYAGVQASGTVVFAYLVTSAGTDGANSDFVACTPAAVPTVTGTPTPMNTPFGPWPGYNDGRLNPDPAEPYSVFCNATTMSVYFRNIQGSGVAQFNLTEIASLVAPDSVTVNGVRFQRAGDAANVSGTNGNYAPQFRQKNFSWAACYKDSVPAITPELAQARSVKIQTTPTQTPVLTEAPQAGNVGDPGLGDVVSRCLYSMYSLGIGLVIGVAGMRHNKRRIARYWRRWFDI